MNSDQIHILRHTWAQVVPMGETAIALFYQRLFEVDPSLQSMFHSVNPSVQHQKLFKALNSVINDLERPDQLLPVLEQLGRRHASYGVRDAHYDSVGAALLWTLKQGLGTAWTPAAQTAWSEAYTLIANIMRNAAPQGAVTGNAPPVATTEEYQYAN